MRLAYFTPLPPSKSGIADYNSELLPYLAKGAEISIFVEEADELRENRDHADFSIHSASEQPTIKLDRDEALGYVAGFFADDPNASAYIKDHSDRLIHGLMHLDAEWRSDTMSEPKEETKIEDRG